MTLLHFSPLLFIISILTLSAPTASSQSNLKSFQTEIIDGKNKFHCDSWKLSVETNNAGPWKMVPSKCVKFVAKYVNGHGYLWDSDIIANEALDFAKTISVNSDGKDVWVFDIDETLLCNVPYYRKNGYGSKPFGNIKPKMIKIVMRRLCNLCCFHSKNKVKVTIRQFKKSKLKEEDNVNNTKKDLTTNQVPLIRVATFNAALFSMAPAVPNTTSSAKTNTMSSVEYDIRGKTANDNRVPQVKGILKQQKYSASKRRVSINLQEDEISVSNSSRGKSPILGGNGSFRSESWRFCERSVLDVLKEVGADIIALQNVKAEEENGMKPLSDLAKELGMEYVFAESWAPQYGNAIFSKWPIKNSRAQKICDDNDIRNVLRATIDIPKVGEVNFHCTHLDHLNETWRLKQISAILQSSDGPHILAGGLNSLDETDYSVERWNDIVKYYEEIGKPTPKAEVMKFLKEKQYTDAKNFAGECESIVIVAKGQDVQGTCKYGTRVDYIVASPMAPYKFVHGSYGVVSSKGTSDHHIVKVDMIVEKNTEFVGRKKHLKQRVVKIGKDSTAIWRTYL